MTICNYCRHQTMNKNSAVCGKAPMTENIGYGSFKQGSMCVYDPDLLNHFDPISDNTGLIAQLQKYNKKMESEISNLRDKNEVLKDRLVAASAPR